MRDRSSVHIVAKPARENHFQLIALQKILHCRGQARFHLFFAFRYRPSDPKRCGKGHARFVGQARLVNEVFGDQRA